MKDKFNRRRLERTLNLLNKKDPRIEKLKKKIIEILPSIDPVKRNPVDRLVAILEKETKALKEDIYLVLRELIGKAYPGLVVYVHIWDNGAMGIFINSVDLKVQ